MSVVSAATEPPRAVPRAPAPNSRNSAELVPKPVLSCAACAAAGTCSTAASATAQRPLRTKVLIRSPSRRKVDDGEPADLRLAVRSFDMIEVDPGGHELVVAIPQV